MDTVYDIKDNKFGYSTLTVYSGSGYVKEGKKLLKIIDNGNGYTIRSYSWTSANPDTYLNIDYADAELIEEHIGLLRGGE
jgi:hypothetical protein